MGFLAALFWCSDNAPDEAADTDVVLAILHRQFHGNNETGVIVGKDNERTITADRALIAKYREWLKTQPRNVVRAYEYWLSFYEAGCNDAEKAIANNARQKFNDRWDHGVTQRLRKAEEASKSFPQPAR